MGQLYKSVAKGIGWFLFLLGVFLATAIWIKHGQYSFRSSDFMFQLKALLGIFEVQVTLFVGSLLGAAFILVLMFADFVSRRLGFPRNIATFVVIVIGINGLTILPFLPNVRLKNLLPWSIVTAILIARNVMRSFMDWAHS